MADPNNEPITKENLFRHLDAGWQQLTGFLNGLSADQLANARDANNWSIKDFIIHLAGWEQGIAGVLRKQSFADAMGIDQELYDTGTEHINAYLHDRYSDVTMDAAVEMLRQSHDQLIAAVQYLTDADLMRPTRDFDPASTDDSTIIWKIVGNSFGHYAEHLGWLNAMVKST